VQYRQEDRTPALASSIIKLGVSGEIQILRK
jgi:L-threonylcarbamoyladenylate synthase